MLLIFLPVLEISFAGAVSWISTEAILGVVGAAIEVCIYQIDQVWNDNPTGGSKIRASEAELVEHWMY